MWRGSEFSHSGRQQTAKKKLYLKLEFEFERLLSEVTHHAQDRVQGEGDVGCCGSTEVDGWSEGLKVKHSLQRLVRGSTVALLTGQFTQAR